MISSTGSSTGSMTSPRKIEANRKNALASTGPKSQAGKQQSARNARRHGLAMPILSDPQASAEVSKLARELSSRNPMLEELTAAARVAEAHLEVVRVRKTRRNLISPALSNSAYWPVKSSRKLPTRKVIKLLSGPPTPEKFTFIIADLAGTFKAMDRYERRALSRRKFAIRELDAAKTKSSSAG
jgi:hypothetical protein